MFTEMSQILFIQTWLSRLKPDLLFRVQVILSNVAVEKVNFFVEIALTHSAGAVLWYLSTLSIQSMKTLRLPLAACVCG